MNKEYDLETLLFEALKKEIEKNINQEINKSVMRMRCREMGWFCVFVKSNIDVTDDWCKRYITRGRYECLGHYWYFEDERDANIFSLAWLS